jgi:hypothetical protein
MPLGVEKWERSLLGENEAAGVDALHPWVPYEATEKNQTCSRGPTPPRSSLHHGARLRKRRKLPQR